MVDFGVLFAVGPETFSPPQIVNNSIPTTDQILLVEFSVTTVKIKLFRLVSITILILIIDLNTPTRKITTTQCGFKLSLFPNSID